MSSLPASMRLVLRDRTRDAHARVDGLADQVASVADPTGCRVFCEAMRIAVHRYGDVLDRCSVNASIAPRAARLVASLDADLRSLDPAWSAPVCERLLVAGSIIEAWGAAYVFEGSAFGAGLLLERARAADLPHRYLSILASERGARWPAVQAAINDITPDGIDTAVASADAAFATVEEALRRAADRGERVIADVV